MSAHEPEAGELHRVVEETIFEPVDETRGGERSGFSHGVKFVPLPPIPGAIP
jgi:hypothetical protein